MPCAVRVGYERAMAWRLDIKPPPAPQSLPARPGRKPRKPKRVFPRSRQPYEVVNAAARLGKWRRLSRCFEQTEVGAKNIDGGRLCRLPLWMAQDRADLILRTSGSSRMTIVPRSAVRMVAVASA